MTPSIGRIVHYVSYGTPGGEYLSECRAAIVTAVQDDETVSLAVINPGGIFFQKNIHCSPADLSDPGSWHEPERV